MCQAKKKKRLEEMLVGAEPPIIVHVSVGKKVTFIITLCFFRLFCVESSFSTIFLWTLTTEGLCEPKEGRGCAVQVAS
jgi:hypothetical protein